MSQDYGAFMKVRIARPDLVRWLEAPLPDPARWTDWRAIGGSWYLSSGIGELANATDADMVENTDKATA